MHKQYKRAATETDNSYQSTQGKYARTCFIFIHKMLHGTPKYFLQTYFFF